MKFHTTKLLTMVMLTVAITGCDAQATSSRETWLRSKLDKVCLDGVGYWYHNNGNASLLAPAYDRNGDIILCGGIEQDSQ